MKNEDRDFALFLVMCVIGTLFFLSLALFVTYVTESDDTERGRAEVRIQLARQKCIRAFDRVRILRELEEMVNPVPLATLQQKDYRRLQECLKATRR